MSALFADGSKLESVLEESKGKAGLNCMRWAPSWLVTWFPCLVSSSVYGSVLSRYTKGGEGPQSGARTPMGRCEPKMLWYKLCSYSKIPSFSVHYISIVYQWRNILFPLSNVVFC